jgi:hypothetical protein
VGSGCEETTLKSMVASMSLSDRVEFCGALAGEKLVSILNRHRVIAIPSRWQEPFGMVALEGMACGCVPIGSDGGGLPEAIGPGGLTFRRGSIEDLVVGLKRLFLEPNLVDKLEERAASHIERHYTDTICAKYLEIFRSVSMGRAKKRLHEVTGGTSALLCFSNGIAPRGMRRRKNFGVWCRNRTVRPALGGLDKLHWGCLCRHPSYAAGFS